MTPMINPRPIADHNIPMSQAAQRLTSIENGRRIKIASFEGETRQMTKLNRFGLFLGDHARVVRQAPFGGPILLEVRGMEIALGRGIADLIFVLLDEAALSENELDDVGLQECASR